MATNLLHVQDIHDCETRTREDNKLGDTLQTLLVQEAQHIYFKDVGCYKTKTGESIASHANTLMTKSKCVLQLIGRDSPAVLPGNV